MVNKYQIEFADNGQGDVSCLTMEISTKNGGTKTLQFSNPEFDVFLPLGIPELDNRGPLYIIDKLSEGYEETRAL